MAIKPASTTKCALDACPVWEAGEWGQVSGSTMTVALNFRRVGSGECLFSVLVHDYALSFVFVRNEYFKDSFSD